MQKPSNANEGCVGPESEQAGKAPSCAGCTNTSACATGPHTPDPSVASQKPPDSNAECVGPQSEKAGSAPGCAGCPSASACATGPRGPDPAIKEIFDKTDVIKHKILVLSGKGGVGKSTLSSQLAFSLASKGFLVGLLDIDICGPSVPRIMGVEGASVHMSADGWTPVWVDDNLCVMSIGFLLGSLNDAVIWRGPKKNGLIKQFLKDVNWGPLDYLIVDSPPGTSDEHLTIAQYLQPRVGKDGAIVVTTPQEVSLLDVRKELNFCKRVNLPVLGVVENMSGFVCPNCQTETQIFAPTTGGARAMAEEMHLPLLGSVPLDPKMAKACDMGESYFTSTPESPAVVALDTIFQALDTRFKEDAKTLADGGV